MSPVIYTLPICEVQDPNREEVWALRTESHFVMKLLRQYDNGDEISVGVRHKLSIYNSPCGFDVMANTRSKEQKTALLKS